MHCVAAAETTELPYDSPANELAAESLTQQPRRNVENGVCLVERTRSSSTTDVNKQRSTRDDNCLEKAPSIAGMDFYEISSPLFSEQNSNKLLSRTAAVCAVYASENKRRFECVRKV
jgi:hypothetical protein